MQAFKKTIRDLNLSQESADIVERLQKLLSKMIKELIAEKDNKIIDLEEERKAPLQDQKDLAQARFSTLEALEECLSIIAS